MAWRGAGARASLALALFGAAVGAACSGSPSPPSGSGDTVIDDTRDAEARPPPNPTPDDAGPDAYQPGAYEDGGPTVTYPGTAECSTCTCDPGVGYCFGGATPKQSRPILPLAGSKDAGAGEAGLPACPLIDAGPGASDLSPQLGCNPLPAGCTTCDCIINLLGNAHVYSCVLECAQDYVGGPMTVFCPSY